ncbi:MAG: ABC transporter permease [Clostridiaceae bacterium]|nr:ABC transporter permease [Clostridiaceae bacterium]
MEKTNREKKNILKTLRQIDKDQMKPLFTATVLLIIVGIFSLINPVFRSFTNLHSIFLNAVPVGLVSIGMCILVMGGFFDMGTGLVASMAGMMVGPLMDRGVPVSLIILIALCMGAVCGALSGFAVSYLNLNAWISTFALSQIYRTILFVTTDGIPFTLASEKYSAFTQLGRIRVFDVIQLPILVLLSVYVLSYLFLRFRRLGRSIYLIGNNPTAAQICGINLHSTRMFMFIFANVLSAMAGLLFTARAGLAQPFACESYTFEGIASAFVGGAMAGKGNLISVFIGALIVFTVKSARRPVKNAVETEVVAKNINAVQNPP